MSINPGVILSNITIVRTLSPVAILVLLLVSSMIIASASPEDGKLHLAPLSDTYILKDCSTCKMFNNSELRIGYLAKKVRLNYLPAVKYKIVITNRSNILLKFNLSKVPPGAKIKVARLWLYIKKPPAKSLMAYLYVLKEGYDENWVTWTQRTSDKRWRVPGGFGEPDYTDRVSIDDRAAVGSSIGFLVTDYVSRVLNGTIEDHGLLILPKMEKLSSNDFPRGTNEIDFYADFFSYEGAKREAKTQYIPDLYVEFEKPTAILELSSNELTLERGSSSSLTVSESGTYEGSVKLGFKVVKAPGLKVGPLKVNISKFSEEPGFSTRVTISAKENAMPGNYVIEFYPITPGYNSDVVYYGKVNLTVTVKGGETTYSPTTTTQESRTETSEGTNTPPVQTTTIPITTSTPTTTSASPAMSTPSATKATKATTSPIVVTVTTVQSNPLGLSSNLTLGILGAVIAVLIVGIIIIVAKRR